MKSTMNQEANIYTEAWNEAMNQTQAKVAQRMKLLDDPNMSHMDKLCQAVSQNRQLTHEQLIAEVYEIKRLAAAGNAKVQHAAQNGRREMGEKMAASSRKECVDMLMNVVGKINEWTANRKHDALNLPEEVRAQLAEVFGCIARQEPISLTKEEIIELTLTLTEQYCMMMTAEHVQADCDEVDAEAFAAAPAGERRELVMAVAMNLKKTGKLPFDADKISNEDYAGMVCAMDAVNGYCLSAAAGKIGLGELFSAVGNICMGAFFMGLGLLFFPTGGFLMGCVSLFSMLSGWSGLKKGVKLVYKSLFPAGISETRVGQAVIKAAHAVETLVERIVGRVVRMVKKVVETLVGAVKKGARAVKQAACTAVKTAKTTVQVAREVIAAQRTVIN